MSKQTTGRATIRIDGKIIESENGATLNPGGVNRDPKAHGGSVYYSEEDVAPTLECTVIHTKDTDIIFLSDITGATVMFEADTGQQFMLRQAFTTEPVAVDSGNGTATLKMSCEKVDKVN